MQLQVFASFGRYAAALAGPFPHSIALAAHAGVGQGQGVIQSNHSQIQQSETAPMGYTHYWNRPQIIDPTKFNAIAQDFLALLPALEAAGAPLANAHGREEPEIGPEFIGFNGVQCCGHSPNLKIRLPWPKEDARGVGNNDGLGANLPYRTCNGDCSCESVWFERCPDESDGDGSVSGFCKTSFRPYDLAVTTFLVIAKHHLGSKLQVQTDGNGCHWAEAFALCQIELAYGAEFSFQQGKLADGEVLLCA